MPIPNTNRARTLKSSTGSAFSTPPCLLITGVYKCESGRKNGGAANRTFGGIDGNQRRLDGGDSSGSPDFRHSRRQNREIHVLKLGPEKEAGIVGRTGLAALEFIGTGGALLLNGSRNQHQVVRRRHYGHKQSAANEDQDEIAQRGLHRTHSMITSAAAQPGSTRALRRISSATSTTGRISATSCTRTKWA